MLQYKYKSLYKHNRYGITFILLQIFARVAIKYNIENIVFFNFTDSLFWYMLMLLKTSF